MVSIVGVVVVAGGGLIQIGLNAPFGVSALSSPQASRVASIQAFHIWTSRFSEAEEANCCKKR
eukprot:5462125-Amphidinium_carterae.1